MTLRNACGAPAAACLLALAATAGAAPAAAEAGLEPSAAVDALFAGWNVPGSPGCAVSVTRAGETLLQRAYGRAVVETDTPNTPSTAFHTASVSKQFTAFAIHLLEADGKLSLDDDLRKHVPEMHDFGAPITIRNLLNHTSGLRDQWELLMLKGRRSEDTITQTDVLGVLFAQRELNFAPGSAFAYSNSNYSLLALIVERASGQGFSAFLEARVFAPLGMTDTYVSDDFHRIRPGQAAPYAPADGGFERRILSFSNYGATDVRSTAADMARWTANLDRPTVGTPAMLAAMATAPTAAGGAPVPYGSGLMLGEYRGAKTVEHSGIDPGYAAFMTTLPAHRFGVSVLCNVETNAPGDLVRRITDIYLGDVLVAPPSAAPAAEVAMGEAELRRLVGTYKEAGGMIFAVTFSDGKLRMQANDEMIPLAGGRFGLRGPPVTFSFSGDEAGGPPTRMVIHDPGMDRPTTRIELPAVADLTPEAMQGLVGRYYSPELRTVVSVEARGQELWLTGPAYEARLQQPPAIWREPDAFYTNAEPGNVRFVRDGGGPATALTTSTGRVMDLRFLRLETPEL